MGVRWAERDNNLALIFFFASNSECDILEESGSLLLFPIGSIIKPHQKCKKHLSNARILIKNNSTFKFHPHFSKKLFGESWHHTAFTQKKLRSFDENRRNTSDICIWWAKLELAIGSRELCIYYADKIQSKLSTNSIIQKANKIIA